MGIHWKSFKSRVKTLRDVSSNIPKDFAFSKSPMGTPLDSIFFAHNFFFQLQAWAQGGTQIKIWFCTVTDLPWWFFGNEGILVSRNSYGHTMVWSSSCMMIMRRTRMEAKTYTNIVQNLLYFRLRNISTYIGSTKFLTKVLWVYSHLKSDFFSKKKLLKSI